MSLILSPLQGIEITASSGKWKVGSRGHIVSIAATNYNLWRIGVLFHRLGKSGKRRLQLSEIHVRMVDESQFGSKDKELFQLIESKAGLMPQAFTVSGFKKDHRGRRLHTCNAVKLDLVSADTFGFSRKDLTQVDSWEFILYFTTLSAIQHALELNEAASDMPSVSPRPPAIQRDRNGEFDDEWSNAFDFWAYAINAMNPRGRANDIEDIMHYFSLPNKRSNHLREAHLKYAKAAEIIRNHNECLIESYSTMKSRMSDLVNYYRDRRNELSKIEQRHGDKQVIESGASTIEKAIRMFKADADRRSAPKKVKKKSVARPRKMKITPLEESGQEIRFIENNFGGVGIGGSEIRENSGELARVRKALNAEHYVNLEPVLSPASNVEVAEDQGYGDEDS